MKKKMIFIADDRALRPVVAPAGDTTMPVRAWQVRWTATPNERRNANPWTVLTPAEYRMNPSRDEVELVRKPDALAMLAAKDAEIARLTQCLAGANSQTEEFERKWHLRGHELEDLTVERDAAITARDSVAKLVDSLNAQLAASRAPATEIEIERAVNPSESYASDWDEVVWRAAEKFHGIGEES